MANSVDSTNGTSRRASLWRWLWHGVVIALVALAAWKYIDFVALGRALLSARPVFLLWLFVLGNLDRLMMAVKWIHLMRAVELRIPFPTVVKVYYQSALISKILPTSLGSDIFRGYAVRKSGAWERILGSLVVEKGVAVIASISLAALGASMLSAELTEAGFGALILAIPVAALVSGAGFYFLLSWRLRTGLGRLIPSRRLRRGLRKVRDAFYLYGSHRRTLAANFCLAMLEQALQVVMLAVSARAIGVEVDTWLLLSVLTLSQGIRKFAVILEGWMLGEFVVVFTCAMTGIDQTHALAFSLLNHAIGFVVSLPGGLLLVTGRGREEVAAVGRTVSGPE